jgi:predicted Fe-S protein YdhL (DUF1289 family)
MSRCLRIAAVLLLAAGVSAAAEKNRNEGPKRPAAAHQPKDPDARPPGQSGQAPNRLRPGTALDRWNSMSPEQRERALQKLPPERQQQIRRRLERFNSLPKEEQDRLRSRYERFSSLPPDRQQTVRRQIRNWSQLPDERRPVVSREFDQLRRLTPEERQARIQSDEFRARFSPHEQRILSDLSDNLALPPRR